MFSNSVEKSSLNNILSVKDLLCMLMCNICILKRKLCLEWKICHQAFKFSEWKETLNTDRREETLADSRNRQEKVKNTCLTILLSLQIDIVNVLVCCFCLMNLLLYRNIYVC